MITEHAVLNVIPGGEADFERALAEAVPLIAGADGFGDLRVERCVEEPSCYLLLVRWRSLEAHTEGFRGSDAYQRWRRLLHPFYDPFPSVRHFETTLTTGPPD